MQGLGIARVTRASMLALGVGLSIGAHAQSFDLDRDLLRDLVTPERPAVGVLKEGAPVPPKRKPPRSWMWPPSATVSTW